MGKQRDLFDTQMDLMDQLHNERQPLWAGLQESHYSFDPVRQYLKEHAAASYNERDEWLNYYMEERRLEGKDHSIEWMKIARTILHR